MADDVAIVNQALILLGEGLVATLGGTDTSTRAANVILPISRKAVLRDIAPHFASKYAELGTAEADNTLIPHFSYVFPLPADSLRVMEVYNQNFATGAGLDAEVRWQLHGQYFGTEIAEGYIRYIYDNGQYDSDWDSLCVDALSFHVAWRLSYGLTESRGKHLDLREEYMSLRNRASTVVGQEGIPNKWTTEGRLSIARRGRGWGGR